MRVLISFPRSFDARRLAYYLVGAALLVGAGIGVVTVVAPDSPGWTTFGVTGTTIGVLVVTVLSGEPGPPTGPNPTRAGCQPAKARITPRTAGRRGGRGPIRPLDGRGR